MTTDPTTLTDRYWLARARLERRLRTELPLVIPRALRKVAAAVEKTDDSGERRDPIDIAFPGRWHLYAYPIVGLGLGLELTDDGWDESPAPVFELTLGPLVIVLRLEFCPSRACDNEAGHYGPHTPPRGARP